MSSTETEHYWTPADKFILNVIEKYGSIAMRCPQIQSPYDLVSWDQIKFDNVAKFKLVTNLKKFYIDFLEKTTLNGDFEQFFKDSMTMRNIDDFGKSLVYRPPMNEKTLMSHPPVFGYWLQESGFITDAHRNNDHEFSYSEYKRLFDLNEARKPTTRKALFPTFEGLSVLSEETYQDHCRGCRFRHRYNTIYAVDEEFSFNSATGNFDKNTFKGIRIIEGPQLYGLSDNPRYELLEIPNHPNSNLTNVFIKAKDDSKYYQDIQEALNKSNNGPGPIAPYVLEYFNDPWFSSQEIGQGFLQSDIRCAYHMNFDLTSQFQLQYRPEILRDLYIKPSGSKEEDKEKTLRFIAGCDVDGKKVSDIKDTMKRPENKITKIRTYPGNIIPKSIKTGRIRYEHPEIEKRDLTEESGYHSDKTKMKGDQVMMDLRKISEDENLSVWLKFPILDEFNIQRLDRNESCYESYSEYILMNDDINEIMNRSHCNYFWFMYGALPINGILYEDLRMLMNWNSVLRQDSLGMVSINDRQLIFDAEESKVPVEFYKEEIIRLNRQMIKFLGLIFKMTDKDIEGKEKIKTYYICNSSQTVKSGDHIYHLLDSPYPKITSSKYVKPEKTVEEKVAEEKKKFPVQPTETDAVVAMGILQKLSTKMLLSPSDFDFLQRTGLLSETGSNYYNILKPDFREDNGQFPLLMRDIENNKDKILQFIQQPKKDVSKFIPPEKANNLIKDIKFTKKDDDAKPPYIGSSDYPKIREIIYYILDPSTTAISKNTFRYLQAIGLLKNTKDNIDKLPWKTVGEKPEEIRNYLIDMDNPKFKEIKKELENSGYQSDSFLADNVTEFRFVPDVDGYDKDGKTIRSGGGGGGQQGKGGGGPQNNTGGGQRAGSNPNTGGNKSKSEKKKERKRARGKR